MLNMVLVVCYFASSIMMISHQTLSQLLNIPEMMDILTTCVIKHYPNLLSGVKTNITVIRKKMIAGM